jgi:ABC-type sugar transport system permease subunit
MKISFIGFKNYINALTVNTSFNRTLTESIINMVVNVPLIVIFSLFLAVLLNQKFIGRSIARSIFFLPVILASGVIMTLETSSLVQAVNDQNQGSGGAIHALGAYELAGLMLDAGVSESIVNYLTSAVERIYQIVSQSGVQILIFLAGIQTISPQLYEASKMEGATGYEAFWKITFPMVSPLILVNMIYTIIDSFSRNEMTDLIKETGFANFDFGLSSAMAWLYFVSIMLILLISSYIVSRKVFYQE